MPTLRKVNKIEAMRYIRVAFSFYGDRMVNCAENMVNCVLPLYEKETIRYNKIWKSVHEGGTFWFVIQKCWVYKIKFITYMKGWTTHETAVKTSYNRTAI